MKIIIQKTASTSPIILPKILLCVSIQSVFSRLFLDIWGLIKFAQDVKEREREKTHSFLIELF